MPRTKAAVAVLPEEPERVAAMEDPTEGQTRTYVTACPGAKMAPALRCGGEGNRGCRWRRANDKLGTSSPNKHLLIARDPMIDRIFLWCVAALAVRGRRVAA